MRRVVLLILVFVAIHSFGQEKITTFILVRHAEKDMTQSTNDPDLSPAGKSRALRLAELLKEGEVTAIYSTPYKRTRQTVQPLAESKTLEIREYALNNEAEIDNMLAKHDGGTIVVSGHSNTVPWFANKLLGTEKYKPMEDGDYGNLWIVTVVEKGKTAKLNWLKY